MRVNRSSSILVVAVVGESVEYGWFFFFIRRISTLIALCLNIQPR